MTWTPFSEMMTVRTPVGEHIEVKLDATHPSGAVMVGVGQGASRIANHRAD